MSRKKTEYKDAGDRFRQISNKRAKSLVKQAININHMLPQPSYDISPSDANDLRLYIEKYITPLVENLLKIENNQPLRGKQTIEDVY